MAQRERLEVLLTLRDEATAKLGKASQAVRNHSAQFRKASLLMGVAAGILGGALGFAVRAGQAQEIAVNKLIVALEGAGVTYADVAEEIKEVTADLQSKTNFGDEAQIDALTTLISLGLDYKEALELLPAVLDIAAGSNSDLDTAARGVALAITDGTGSLSRLLPKLSETEDKTGRVLLVTALYKGQAEAAVDPINQMKNSLGDLAEALEIVGPINDVATAVREFADAISSSLPEGFLANVGKALLIAFGALTIGAIVAGIAAIIGAVSLMTAVIAVGVVALLAGIVLIIAGWDDMIEGYVGWANFFSESWSTLWKDALDVISLISPFIVEVASLMWEDVLNVFAAIKRPIIDAATAIWDGVFAGLESIGVISAWEFVWTRVVGIVSGARDILLGIIRTITDKIAGVVEVVINARNLFTGITLPSLPKLRSIGIPGLAHGGIVTSPTIAMIGETGPEAVVPLSGGGGFGGTVNVILPSSSLLVMTDDTAVERFTSSLMTEIRQQLRRQHGF